MYILGAGMAGCLAAIHFPEAVILEGNDGPQINHRALLRMRTTDIQELTGIEFRKVVVNKFIYDMRLGICHQNVSPKVIAEYSRKTTGIVTKRSITNLKEDVRWIPPDDFHARMLTRLDGRIKFGQRVTELKTGLITTTVGMFETGEPIISTLPMPVNLKATGKPNAIDFQVRSRPIYITRILVPDYDLDTTIYFPDTALGVYRASMIGNLLVIESVETLTDEDVIEVISAFSLSERDVMNVLLGNKKQENGKIQPIDDWTRKTLLHAMTQQADVYSLGRFACWRQILLDDVIKDIEQINKMITTQPYDRNLS